MKKQTKIFFFLGVILFAGFLFLPHLVKADIGQSIDTSSDSAPQYYEYQDLGTGLSGVVSNLFLRNQQLTNEAVGLCISTSGVPIGQISSGDWGASQRFTDLQYCIDGGSHNNIAMWWQNADSSSGSGSYYSASTNTGYLSSGVPYTLDPTKYYFIGFKVNGSKTVYGSSNSTAYLNSTYDFWQSKNGVAGSEQTTVHDLAFNLTVGPATPSINLLTPTSTATSSAVFPNFKVEISNPDSKYSGYVGVQYALSTSTIASGGGNVDKVPYSFYTAGEPVPVDVFIPRTHAVWYSPLNSTVEWFVRPFIQASSSVVYGDYTSFIVDVTKSENSTSTFSFVFDPTSTSSFNGQLWTSTSSNLAFTSSSNTFYNGGRSLTCEDSSTLWSSFWCHATLAVVNSFQFVFTPPQGALNELNSVTDSIKSTFPFSIPFQAQASISDSVTANVNNPVDYSISRIQIPQVGIDVTPFSSTTLEDEMINSRCDRDCSRSFKDQIFKYERMFIWGSAGVLGVVLIF